MKIPAIITTCQRPNGVSYYENTSASVRDAGFWKRIFHDTSPKLGIVPSYRLALWIAFSEMKWDRLAVFQDDVLVARGLHDWLASQDLPEGVISLYTPSARSGPDGWQELNFTPTTEEPLPWMNCVGACAILFTRELAEWLLELPPPLRTDRLGSWIAESCYNGKVPFWVHNPSLVQHVGVQSCRVSMPFNAERQAARFCENVEELA